jgi:NAD(P)-dependent dehydrogenase (short-subunit alcohol dehydrogenase family)
VRIWARRRTSTVFETVSARWDALNVLVNAAGPVGAGRFEDLGDARGPQRSTKGDLAVRCVRAALPLLRAAPWARVVNVTAMSVQHQSAGLVLHRRQERIAQRDEEPRPQPRGRRHPGQRRRAGSILTDWARPMLAAAGIEMDDSVGAFGLLGRDHGMSVDLGRLGLPQEVANVIAFCASRANTYMTGAHLNVDGGSDFL